MLRKISDFLFMAIVSMVLVLSSIALIIFEFMAIAFIFCLLGLMNLRASNTSVSNSVINK
jgi:hypothetical protein